MGGLCATEGYVPLNSPIGRTPVLFRKVEVAPKTQSYFFDPALKPKRVAGRIFDYWLPTKGVIATHSDLNAVDSQ
jgi:hypothetical protein